MLQSMGSQRAGYDLVTERHLVRCDLSPVDLESTTSVKNE